MFFAYVRFISRSGFDWAILAYGFVLLYFHADALCRRLIGKDVNYFQNLDRHRTVLLSMTELLPLLGLLGTALSLLATFDNFRVAAVNEAPDLAQMVQSFAPALSTTISGLIMTVPNLFLNAWLWLVCPDKEEGLD